MKKFSVFLLTTLLLFTAISCRQVVFLPMPLPGGNEDVNPDVPPVSEEDIAADEVVRGIVGLYNRIEELIEADDGVGLSGEVGPETADILFEAGETLTLVDPELTDNWKYAIKFKTDFTVDGINYDYATTAGPDDENSSVYNGTIELCFNNGSYTETTATSENPFDELYLVGPAVEIELRNLDLNNPSMMASGDVIFVDGTDILESFASEGAEFGTAVMNTLIQADNAFLRLLMNVWHYKHASEKFAEYEPGEYKKGIHQIIEFDIEADGEGYTIYWDNPNIDLAELTLQSDDGKLSLNYMFDYVTISPIFRSCTYNGISLNENMLSDAYDKLFPNASLDFIELLDDMADPDMQLLRNLLT